MNTIEFLGAIAVFYTVSLCAFIGTNIETLEAIDLRHQSDNSSQLSLYSRPSTKRVRESEWVNLIGGAVRIATTIEITDSCCDITKTRTFEIITII